MIYMNLQECVETFKASLAKFLLNFDEHLGRNENFSHRGAAWYFQNIHADKKMIKRKTKLFENVILPTLI